MSDACGLADDYLYASQILKFALVTGRKQGFQKLLSLGW